MNTGTDEKILAQDLKPSNLFQFDIRNKLFYICLRIIETDFNPSAMSVEYYSIVRMENVIIPMLKSEPLYIVGLV